MYKSLKSKTFDSDLYLIEPPVSAILLLIMPEQYLHNRRGVQIIARGLAQD